MFRLSTQRRFGLCCALVCFWAFSNVTAQDYENARLKRIAKDISDDSVLRQTYEDVTFYIGKMLEREKKGLELDGYIDTYYAYYTDSVGIGAYQKIPSISPRTGFGLNYLLLSARYTGDKFRSTIILHYGDVAKSAWDPTFNLIQEANLGLRVLPKLWIDAGFFRTHLGVESIQPRENISMSLASTTFYDPYYLSGAKLTYYLTNAWTLQLHVFSSYNNYVDNNSKITMGWSAHCQTGRHFFSFNGILTDESPDNTPLPQTRYYQNGYWAYKGKTFDLSVEGNVGWQKNSQQSNPTGTALMYSALGVGRYKFADKNALYARVEYFNDQDAMLTGPILANNETPVGLHLWGVTAGYEFKPTPNSYFRLEGRRLETENNETIFYYKGQFTNIRYEFITALGVWF